MNIVTNTQNWKWVAGIVLLLALSRLIPHPPNFTPLGAMAILAGATIKDFRLALLIPLSAMLASDIFLGFHSSMLFVYASVAIIVLACHFWLKKLSLISLGLAALFAAILFFLVTNFGAWLSHDMYAHTIGGLGQAYTAGIPFFKNTLLSNLFFIAISFYALKTISGKKVFA